jgi:hydroxymethylpyrimidine pyrophosphatase-like HAD family hydrolase
MPNENLVFTDVDGTLCFHEDQHKVQKIRDTEAHEDGDAVVQVAPSKREVHALDVSTSLYRVYLDVATRTKARILSAIAPIILVTGARPSTMKSRLQAFNFQNGSILENGAAIYNKGFQRDPEWDSHLAPQKALLAPAIENLQARGLKLDIKGRTAMIRIRHKDNPHLDEDEFSGLYATLELPQGLKKTKNLGNIDIILESAGKGEAIKYLLDQQNGTPNTFGIGDDLNDLELLEAVDQAFVLGSAYPEALELARRKGMYVSEGHYFDGINEILDEISSRIQR